MSVRSIRAASTFTPIHTQFVNLFARGSAISKPALLLIVALLASAAQAQYNWTPTMSLADNTPWCATNNCLTSIAGITVETKAGIDGTIYGLNSAHQLFTYTAKAGWVLAPSALQSAGGYPLMHISVGSASNVLALNTSAGSNIYVLNSAGTAWQLLGGWLSMAEIGADGTIWGINLENSTIYTWTGSAWVAPGGLLSNIAVGSSGNVWGVNPYNQIFLYVGGSEVWREISVPFTPSSAENAIAATGDMAIAVLDTSGGIHVSTNEGNTWSTIEGTASSISGGSFAMFVRNSSGVSYHVNLLVPAVTNTAAGFWACPPAEGCPTGSYHTLYATVYFGGNGGAHGTAGVTTQISSYPENQIQTAATENGSNCDPFFGDPNSPSCLAYYDGNAVCSVMGALGGVSSIIQPPQLGVGYDLLLNQSPKTGFGCVTTLGVTYCNFLVSPSCTNTPQYAPPLAYDTPPAEAGWYDGYYCGRFSSSQPWSCLPIPGSAVKTTDTGPVKCPFYVITP